MKTLIIIPARMASTRFPNKPMALINNKPMIQHVWEKAKKANIGRVIVACSEQIVADCIKSVGGEAILTDPNLPSGTDRIYAAVENDEEFLTLDTIINLQGDMPLIDNCSINNINKIITQGYDLSTLVTSFSSKEEKQNENITKAKVQWIKKEKMGEAVNFYKVSDKSDEQEIYHHVGIYGFSPLSLKKFVSLEPSLREKETKLEQMRALDNGMSIGVGYIKNIALSVDTREDLVQVERLINNNE